MITGLPLIYTYRTKQCSPVGKDCTMNSLNRIARIVASLFSSPERSHSVTARALFERATHARGVSRFEAAQLRANAQAMLNVVR
jgi:hypothetical protein